MPLLFENQITGADKNQFLAKVVEVAQKLKINPNWLMIVMRNESGFRADIVNKQGGATGLIQFMPLTAKGLGTSTAALAKMSRPQQMEFVYKYYKPYAGKITGYKDLYMITFYPLALAKPLNFVLGSERGKAAALLVGTQNKPFDLNKDGVIHKGEFYQYLDNKYGADGTGGTASKKTTKSTGKKTNSTNKNTPQASPTNNSTSEMLPLLLAGLAVAAMQKDKKK